MATRGITLLDLFAPWPGSQSLLPDALAGKLENLAVVEHRSTVSAGAFVHEGVVQPIADLGFPALRNWPVEVPGLNAGLPFRLVRTRIPTPPGQILEPAADAAFLDLVVDRIAITVPGLKPARLVPPAAAAPAHLLPDGTRTDVRIVGSGVVRIDLSGGGDVLRFVDWPDPFDPAAPTGAVVRVTFDPISFFFGDSDIGMVADRLVFDASRSVTPPEIIERGQTPGWQGIAIAEATLLLPPNGSLVDKVNVSVRDVLLGNPAGLQGSVSVELGRTPINAAAVDFTQLLDGVEHHPRPGGSDRALTVPFVDSTPETARMRATLNPASAGTSTRPQAEWTLPDGRTVPADDSGWFTAALGQSLQGRFSEEVPDRTGGPGDDADDLPDRVADEPTTYTFVAPDASEPAFAPQVVVHVGAVDLANVVAVSGSAAALDLLEFNASTPIPGSAALRWRYGNGPNARTRTGHDFLLEPGSEVGTRSLVLTDAENRSRRVQVEVLAQGPLLIGAADGVHDATGALVEVRGVEATYQLTPFHREALLQASTGQATLAGPTVTLPGGALAAVTVALGTPLEPEAPAPPLSEAEIRQLSVRFGYNTADPAGWGVYAPRNPAGAIATSVSDWAAYFPGATFLVLAHCCDIGTDAQNAQLATRRIGTVTPWLSGRTVVSRGEQDPATGPVLAAQGAVSPPLPEHERSAGRLIELDYDDATRASWGDVTTHPVREAYRRVDVYAVSGTYTPPDGAPADGQQAPQDTQLRDPALRRSLIPGADAIEPPPPADPRLAYLIRLEVEWDSPTVTGWGDAIPTRAEFTLAWATSNVTTMPDPDGHDTTLPVRAPSEPTGTTSTEVYTLIGRWSYDSRSGETVFSLSIASSGDPLGLAAVDSTFVAVALALAPALLAGLDPSEVEGSAVRLTALAVATAVLTAKAKEGELIIHAAEAEYRARSLRSATGSRTRVLLDYTASVGFDIEASGLGSLATDDGSPFRVRYRGVGLEFDDGEDAWYDKVGLVFDDVSFEVADPGRWKLAGPLGDLLQVVASRAGVGSSWFELDLEFALDLGVVAITGARVRATFGDGGFSAELRGLGVSVDIPGVLAGEGRLAVGDGGAFTAALELDLVSVGAKAMGALAFDPVHDYLSISVGLLLPVGIPLAATGLGIFGFLGLFVSNGARQLPTGFDDDPVGREIAWYRDVAPDAKFGPERGQWAVGLGMIVGTLPDQAFTFNATGMFVVAFPDPTVIFGIDAKLVRQPAITPTTAGTSDDPSLEILGLVAIDDEAVLVGVRGRYVIPKVLELLIPIDGYFPYPTTPGRDAFVRIGSDGVADEGRPGDPVSIVLLPDTLDVEAFSYLMVEEHQLHRLGGDPDFSFDGFCVGFGAGFEIRWSAGPIKLEAGALILVGFGTNPFLLKGGIMVHGTLDLVILSISATGRIVCTIWEDDGVRVNLAGEFCGSVSLFFFEISGCVGVEVGDSLTPQAPPPPPPIGKVSLTDRRGSTTALAVPGPPGPEETVWPDTVPVIEFTHHLEVHLPADSAFTPGGGPAAPPWSGTSELKYAYRLTGVDLVPDGETALTGPLASGWWMPTYRPGVLAEGDVAVSADEGMVLALLAWNPAPWTHWLTEGGAGTDGDPAGTPGRLCDPPLRPRRHCLPGGSGRRTGISSVRFRTAPVPAAPLQLGFALTARERAFGRTLDLAVPLLAPRGLSLRPGHVGAGGFGDDVWWLATLDRYGFVQRTTELRGVPAPNVVEPELLLVVCRDLGKRPSGPRDPSRRSCEAVSTYVDKPDRPITQSLALGRVTVNVARPTTTGLTSDRERTIVVPEGGLFCVLPEPTAAVRVTLVLNDGFSEVTGRRRDGTVVDRAVADADAGPLLDVVLRDAGGQLESVRIGTNPMAGSTTALVGICWNVHPDDQGGDEQTEPEPSSRFPVVSGQPVDGPEKPWSPDVLKTVSTGRSQCSLVRYTPERSSERYRSVRVREWAGTDGHDAGGVGVARFCGISAGAAALADANAAFVADLTGLIGDHALGDPDAPTPAQRDLLSPATGYTLRVSWQWQGWVRSEDAPEPPDVPADADWQDAASVEYRFRTAATALADGTPPAELVDEHAFDPRSLIRYLLAFEPDTGSAPHLRDDDLLVHLSVDHTDQLAALYGRALGLRLRRTDPPPGSLAGADHPADEPLLVAWGPLFDGYRSSGERRLLEGIRAAPCLDEPSLGGTTGTVSADLVAGAWYDLTVMCTPAEEPAAEETVISRAHFQASRYRNVDEILTALGFGLTEPAPFIAGDAIVSGPLPAGFVVGSSDLDAALSAAGLDPWPVTADGRTSVLWQRAGAAWLLAGVVLELPEPIVRSGRTALAVTGADYGGRTLLQRRRNESGTRVLLAPAAPVAVAVPVPAEAPFAAPLTLTLTRTVTDRFGVQTSTSTVGHRTALAVPRTIYQEAGA